MPKLRESIHAAAVHDEPIQQPVHTEERVRLRKGADVIDPFYIPPEIVPPGMSLNWKRYTVGGKEDFAEMRLYQEQGWRAVQQETFSGVFAPPGASGPVIVRDMILMERPMHLTREAEHEDLTRARSAVSLGERKMAETPDGQAPRMAPEIRKSREAISVPE